MLTGKYFITPHAVRSFVDRIAPRMSYDRALSVIVRGLESCGEEKPLRNRQGFYVRVRGAWNFRAVIGRGDGPLPAVITILRSGK